MEKYEKMLQFLHTDDNEADNNNNDAKAIAKPWVFFKSSRTKYVFNFHQCKILGKNYPCVQICVALTLSQQFHV